MNLATSATTTTTTPRHGLMPLNPSSSSAASSLRRPLFASLRKISPLTPMASAPASASAALSTAASADNGAAKPAEKQPVQVAKRLEKFKTTIFTQMSMLAVKHGAINLGQGFPNFDGPDFVKEAAIKAISAGKNQYARGYGVPELNSAVAERFLKDSGLQVDPDKEVTVTSGCTEAIAATILGLINPGDEVILFAPFYDSYEATLSMAGADVKAITLRPPDFAVPLEELKAAVSKNTRAIMINTPHNPTGKMFTREELEFIADLCKENDVLLFADEVYDKLAFEADHISMASIPGMYERTVTMNSLGKTFSLTGWKIGWAIAPPHLTWGVRQAHSFLTFATSTPMQSAAAAALRAPESYFEELKRDYGAKKALLVDGLKAAGFIVYPSSGTYFVMVDHTPFGFDNDVEFCEYLIREVGVVAIPPSVFYLNPEDGKNLVRFTFCKDDDTLRAAVDRMKAKLRKK
ncbi:probable N-succinyldiaminopimelate aminotransferase DapC [Lolium rigidum]|uniref:probable N-succinyldiaminopimelate aminotransferase DapC n=1 Tax=Lolium rigidum TaxID=89674 RepID=UPI001F5D74AE|nr:probable N-succinyldiaminopimelate aminotransferase DapC [Lolium rigidum]